MLVVFQVEENTDKFVFSVVTDFAKKSKDIFSNTGAVIEHTQYNTCVSKYEEYEGDILTALHQYMIKAPYNLNQYLVIQMEPARDMLTVNWGSPSASLYRSYSLEKAKKITTSKELKEFIINDCVILREFFTKAAPWTIEEIKDYIHNFIRVIKSK